MEHEQKTDAENRIPLRRNINRRGIIFGLIILICGILIGAGVIMLLMRYNHSFFHIYRKPKITVIVERMERELGLTDKQKADVIHILKKREGEMKPVMRAEFQKTDELIKEILSDEQWKRWEEIQKQRREKRNKSS